MERTTEALIVDSGQDTESYIYLCHIALQTDYLIKTCCMEDQKCLKGSHCEKTDIRKRLEMDSFHPVHQDKEIFHKEPSLLMLFFRMHNFLN